jgi:hypothetical protein
MSLELAAKFLGVDYKPYHKYPVNFMGDDELCMALLRRAAERGLFTQLEYGSFDDAKEVWIADIGHRQGIATTPLAAVLAAVAALEGV